MTNFQNGFFPGSLQPDAVVGGCINIYENVWPNPAETIRLVEEQCTDSDSGVFWAKAGTIGEGMYQNYRTNRVLSVSQSAMIYNNPLMQNIHNQFYMMLLAALGPYTEKYRLGESLYHEGYNLLKYGTDEEYKLHYDTTSQVGRVISALCYLNDDYEGGEIEFPNFDLKIKPQAGMMILFPSAFSYIHTAHPVKAGTKYCLVTWIRDRPIN